MIVYSYYSVETYNASLAHLGGGLHAMCAPVWLSEKATANNQIRAKRLVWAVWGPSSFAIYKDRPYVKSDEPGDALYVKDFEELDLSDEVDESVFTDSFDGWDDVAFVMYHLYRADTSCVGYLGAGCEGVEL